MTQPSGDRPKRTRVRSLVDRAVARGDDVVQWVAERRPVSVPLDVAVRIYQRDRDSYGSVLGSALAFRLFLFLVPLWLLLLGVASLVVGDGLDTEEFADQTGVSFRVATDVEQALSSRQTTALFLLAAGLFGTAWAGRSLSKVLSAVSARAWELSATEGKATVRIIGTVTGLLALVVAVTIILERVREAAGIAATATSFIGVLVAFAAMWFLLSLALPRATSDPGAALPGAALVGLTSTALQWFAQYYLPARISSKTDVLGGTGVVVVALGWLFITARVMTLSFVVNAVVFERIGSVSELVFSLPLLRGIPRRYPVVARFFDLGPRTDETESDTVIDSLGADDPSNSSGA